MNLPEVVTETEWQAAREALLDLTIAPPALRGHPPCR